MEPEVAMLEAPRMTVTKMVLVWTGKTETAKTSFLGFLEVFLIVPAAHTLVKIVKVIHL